VQKHDDDDVFRALTMPGKRIKISHESGTLQNPEKGSVQVADAQSPPTSESVTVDEAKRDHSPDDETTFKDLVCWITPSPYRL
jgi:hypothetical protein